MVASRTILQSDSDFYVSQSGDDNNSGATAVTAKKTPQAMMDTLFREYDHGGVRVRVNCAGSSIPYPGFSIRGAWAGHYGQPMIFGETPTFEILGVENDPEAVTIDGIQTVVGKSLHMDWMTITNSAGGNAVHASLTGSEMVAHNVIIGDCGTGLYAEGTGAIIFSSGVPLIWKGACNEFAYADGGEIRIGPSLIARGSCSASDFIFGATRNGVVRIPNYTTFVTELGASVSGQKWAIARGGQIDTGGRDPNTLPGTINGAQRIAGSGGYCG